MDFKITTNCFVYRHPHLLLGLKKRGFGQGRWNGFGGKVEAGETLEQAAMRELHEECGLVPRDLAHAGKARFTYQGKDKEVEVHFFKITDFSGEPVETEEMKPQWFHIQELPYQNMWPDDVHWMPHFLSGQKFEGTFVFEGFDKILNHEIQVMS